MSDSLQFMLLAPLILMNFR